MLERHLRERSPVIYAFGDRLRELEKEIPAISAAQIRRILVPRGGVFGVLGDVLDLPALEARLTGYQHMRATLQEDFPPWQRKEVPLLERLIDLLTKQREILSTRARELKINPRKPWGVPRRVLRQSTPAELAARGWQARRWEWIGDRAMALVDYLTRKIAGQRTAHRGRIGVTAPRPYKAKVLCLAAELVTLAYQFPYFPDLQARPFSPEDIKSRIAARRSRS